MQTKKDIFNTLLQINKEIQEQMPNTPNYWPEYNKYPKNKKNTDEEKAYNAAYSKLCEEYNVALILYGINQYVTEIFENFLKVTGANRTQLTQQEKSKLKTIILNEAKDFNKKTRNSEILLDFRWYESTHLDTDQYIIDHVDQFIETLCQGQTLSLENADLQNRCDQAQLLHKLRETADTQSLLDDSYYLKLGDQTNIIKPMLIYKGALWDRLKATVGVCDEHACLALYKIFKHDYFVTSDMRVEKITATYKDPSKANEDTGHTFLVINRKKDSNVSDISTWGPEAIIFDSWHNFVCYASDYANLPDDYFCYSEKDGVWKSIEFSHDDKLSAELATQFDQYFAITGYSNLEKRRQRVMEEYELTALDKLPFTSHLIQQLKTQLALPPYFYDIEIMITTAGNKFVSVVQGLNQPKIAIHKECLNLLLEHKITLDELRFGLANAYETIHKNGIELRDLNLKVNQVLIDTESLKSAGNYQAAIDYLRDESRYLTGAKKNSLFNKAKYKIQRNAAPSNDARIKSFETLLAKDESLKNVKHYDDVDLDQAILSEIKPLSSQSLFVIDTNLPLVDQINYLTGQLPLLADELIPYEVGRKTGRRVKQFCERINSIEINEVTQEISSAFNRLLDHAFELRIPAFDEIYRNVVNKISGINHGKYAKIPAHGIYNRIQHAITNFVNATTFEEANARADEFISLFNQIKETTYEGRDYKAYTKKYLKLHKCLPQGEDRYFSSWLSSYVDLTGFKISGFNNAPWSKHLAWAKDNKQIAYTLWTLGVQMDPVIWKHFSPKELIYRAIHTSKFTSLVRFEYYPICYDTVFDRKNDNRAKLIGFALAQERKKGLQPFDDSLPFEQALDKFYDDNWAWLSFPTMKFSDISSDDNDGVNLLLTRFTAIALNGTDEEKLVVKKFLISHGKINNEYFKANKKDFYHLQYLSAMVFPDLEASSPYVKFVLDQTYHGQSFNLFSIEEKKLFLTSAYPKGLTAKDYVKIFKLPFTDLTIECLEQLIPLMLNSGADFEIIFKTISDWINKNKPFSFLSPSSAKIVRLFDSIYYYLETDKIHKILDQLKWDLSCIAPDTSAADIVDIYRTIDRFRHFPSLDKMREFSQIILNKIIDMSNDKDRLDVLNQLLLNKDYTFAISDMELRTRAIKIWIDTARNIYGIDDGSESYRKQIEPLIDQVKDRASARDKELMLSELANQIEAQYGICEKLGLFLDEKHYTVFSNDKTDRQKISGVAQFSTILNQDKETRMEILGFLSEPYSKQSADKIVKFIHDKAIEDTFIRSPGEDNLDKDFVLHNVVDEIYRTFWENDIERRAVIIDYLLIPPTEVIDKNKQAISYLDAFEYVTSKLFPEKQDVKSDDHFAVSFLKSYLEAADEFQREFFLSGMLVAAKESANDSIKLSTGKKLALLCEHLGPAYVKMAQAIHSYPHTPESIRNDLSHMKSMASPPKRYELLWLIKKVVPADWYDQISHVGSLLGSASYNLAVDVTLKDGRQIVLLLLRENAEAQAKEGFSHIRKAVNNCDHPRMKSIREDALSIIDEAEKSSRLEMDLEASNKQFEIAKKIYQLAPKKTEFAGDTYSMAIHPATLLHSGMGYRFLEKMHGQEFNRLPQADHAYRKLLAKSLIELELRQIFSGDNFDTDRHGNQLKINLDKKKKIIDVGLYDFGEMSLEKPNPVELKQMAELIDSLPGKCSPRSNFYDVLNAALTEKIKLSASHSEPTTYLMRVRKALLALRDFQKELTQDELIVILNKVAEQSGINPAIQSALKRVMLYTNAGYVFSSFANSVMSFFSNMLHQHTSQNIEVNDHTKINESMPTRNN